MTVCIRSLHVYPIKGCAGLDVDAIEINDDGLIVGDRSAMIVDAATGRFLSQRQLPQLARLHATWAAERSLSVQIDGADYSVDRPDRTERRRVTVWDDTFDADDAGDAIAARLSDWLGVAARLVFLATPTGRVVDPFWTANGKAATSFADLAPALLTNVVSLEELNRRRVATGLLAVPMSRFRPNIVVEGAVPFAEDGWATLSTSDDRLTLRCIKPCARCDVTEIDQSTGEVMGDEVLKTLASFRTLTNARGTRGVMFGQNVTFTAEGRVKLRRGDDLTVEAKFS